MLTLKDAGLSGLAILMMSMGLILDAAPVSTPPSSSSDLANVSAFHPTETVAERAARMEWWHQAKFGMFVHFGLYAIPADTEWHMRNQKESVAEYAKLAAQFNPTQFDANAWARIAHDAGMKYMVFVTKHHDGFANFKTNASTFNIVDATPFKRDIVKELSEACPKYDVRFGTYYSAAADWSHPGGGAGIPHWDPAQDGDNLTYVKTIAVPEIHDLLTKYGTLGEFWFDTDGAKIVPEGAALIAKEMNLQPQLIIDDRLQGWPGDFKSEEQRLTPLRPKGDWEACTTVNGAWGYNPKPGRPYEVLLRELIDVVSKGGNDLLNVGPNAQGVIPSDSVDRLTKIGAWMKVNGESIYGTTAGPFDYLSWGRCTRKGDLLYLQVFDWPTDGILHVPLPQPVTAAYLLSDPSKPLTYKSTGGKLQIHLPPTAPDPVASVVVIKVTGAPTPLHSLALNAPVLPSAPEPSKRYAPENAVDDDPTTTWRTPAGPTYWLQVDLGAPESVGAIRVGLPGGRRRANISKFALEYKVGDQWKPAFQNVNMPRDIYVKNFPPVIARYYRLNVEEGDGSMMIASFELFPPE